MEVCSKCRKEVRSEELLEDGAEHKHVCVRARKRCFERDEFPRNTELR